MASAGSNPTVIRPPPPQEVGPDLSGDLLALMFQAEVTGIELLCFHTEHVADPAHSKMRCLLSLFVLWRIESHHFDDVAYFVAGGVPNAKVQAVGLTGTGDGHEEVRQAPASLHGILGKRLREFDLEWTAKRRLQLNVILKVPDQVPEFAPGAPFLA